jgi:hypothetical protein
MVAVRCFTNLDDYKTQEWPERLPAVPSIGHWVQAKSGKVLKIVGLTWQYDGVLRIELHRIA